MPDTVTGFNVNIDRVIPVTRDLLDNTLSRSPHLADLSARLVRSMQYCTAEEVYYSDSGQYGRIVRDLENMGTPALGGQAGIAALHLVSLGKCRVLLAAPLHGPQSKAILESAGVAVPDMGGGSGPASDPVHLVFEYSPGLVPPAPGTVSRSNRFIVSPVHPPSSALVPDRCMEEFLSSISTFERAFLSGYQYLRTDAEFSAAAAQATAMKRSGPALRTHFECVSVTDKDVLAGIARRILPCVDSVGLNEHELVILLENLGLVPPGTGEGRMSTPRQVIGMAITLFCRLRLRRLHVHTYGYYVLVRSGDDGNASRDALLYASAVAARTASGNESSITATGMEAVRSAAAVLGPESSPGVFPITEGLVIIVPTLIGRDITKTSGLGDIISSTAFVADRF
jgi:ADP-dependent phosphofructokinase/glucokinase